MVTDRLFSIARVTDIDDLRNVLAWHNHAEWFLLGAVSALLEATDFDAKPANRHEARDAAKHNLRMAHMALENATMIREVDE